MIDPKSCATIEELRVGIDALDAELTRLMALRAAFIDRASELKPGKGIPARVNDRVEEVAQNARRNAEAVGWDPDLAERLWREMIEWSIAREERVIGPS